MFKIIAQWKKERKLTAVNIKMKESSKLTEFTRNLHEWYDLMSDDISDTDVFAARIWVGFKDSSDLIEAIKILDNNIVNGQRKDLPVRESTILLDDWFVDKDSYRTDINEVFKEVLIALDAVVLRLPNLSSTVARMHNVNAEVITVTLQNIVEICSRR